MFQCFNKDSLVPDPWQSGGQMCLCFSCHHLLLTNGARQTCLGEGAGVGGGKAVGAGVRIGVGVDGGVGVSGS